MKLEELTEDKPFVNEPKYGFWEPTKNDKGIMGVRLAFVEPTMPRFNAQIKDATEKHDKNRRERVELKKQNYKTQGQSSFPHAPDLGWWSTKASFENEEESIKGYTKGNIYQKHPNLKIYNSRKEAESAAKKDGLI